MKLELTNAQRDQVFLDQLGELTGDYRRGKDGQAYSVTWCGDPSCGGHDDLIVGDTDEAKVRLAAIALAQALAQKRACELRKK